ncbi:hypothetical protein K461DRAFT_318855 [Myriangium duriaei CBS 260.36]|uniref:Altered inheritance of mitochondria protein 32 n=1 Tax=Myriangium duriaei CBS 260.36 TaxID=1168546 RepID=A0A9P4MKF4_9PEZI|nr:hypothetical protein K461DRAFT_318855 [Myriangium duriaei CBS 260.36]
MFWLANGCRRSAASALNAHLRFSRTSRSASRISIPTPPPFPVVERCPVPTCQCQDMPEKLEIDREAPLNGTTAAYAEQILISTGRSDWKSRIDEDDDAVFARQLKKYLGRDGKFSDPFHNVMITNSSFAPASSRTDAYADPKNPSGPVAPKPGSDPEIVPDEAPVSPPASAFLLPSFQYVPSIPTDDRSIEAFLKAFVLPSQLHAMHDALTREQKNVLLRQPEMQAQFLGSRPVDEIVILVCGHMARDKRCGILAPILMAEFRDKLARQNVTVLEDQAPPVETRVRNEATEEYKVTARVGSISHIGGHKFAGNVIVYIPPSFRGNALNGKGIWYGRVEPGHVEGIVAQTVLGGKVIKELFRGGIGQGGEALRL